MANGRGTRWDGHLGIPKQLLKVNGETLLQRITRQVHEQCEDAEVIISSSNPKMEAFGALRYEPETNEIELDRFVPELLQDGVTFLYGDTFYLDSAVERIVGASDDGLEFFGDDRSIVAVHCAESAVMRKHVEAVRDAYLSGKIEKCIGWQVYQSYEGLPYGRNRIEGHFVDLTGLTAGFNSPDDHAQFMSRSVHAGTAD